MKDLPNTEPVTGESSSAVDWQRTLAELRQAVRAVDPAAFLILPRILRRVIKQDCRLTGFGLKVPHRKSYVIGREALLEAVDKDELGLDDDAEGRRRVAEELACSQCLELVEHGVHEFHFYTLNRADLTIAICQQLGTVTPEAPLAVRQEMTQ